MEVVTTAPDTDAGVAWSSLAGAAGPSAGASSSSRAGWREELEDVEDHVAEVQEILGEERASWSVQHAHDRVSDMLTIQEMMDQERAAQAELFNSALEAAKQNREFSNAQLFVRMAMSKRLPEEPEEPASTSTTPQSPQPPPGPPPQLRAGCFVASLPPRPRPPAWMYPQPPSYPPPRPERAGPLPTPARDWTGLSQTFLLPLCRNGSHQHHASVLW